MYESYQRLLAFFELGGPVLYAILFAAILLWFLILERFFFLWFQFPRLRTEALDKWHKVPEKRSWKAQKIRQAILSKVHQRLNQNVSLIQTVIAVCPFLGIVGTVTGMIAVFDVISFLGTGNARAMASGIARATLPTLAGLVTAISGLYFASRLKFLAEKYTERVSDELINEG
jgi:biopolymer transport protein ExbB